MAKAHYLSDKNGDKFYPYAHTSATYLPDGTVLTDKLANLESDIFEYDSKDSFPAEGKSGKIYIDKSENITYRWDVTEKKYVAVGSSLELGETSTTAYPGDKGKKNAEDIAEIKDEMPVEVELTKAEYAALPDSKLTDGITYYITDGEGGGGEGGGEGIISLTEAEYEALPEDKKNKGAYCITDAPDGVTVGEVNEKVNVLNQNLTTLSEKLTEVETLELLATYTAVETKTLSKSYKNFKKILIQILYSFSGETYEYEETRYTELLANNMMFDCTRNSDNTSFWCFARFKILSDTSIKLDDKRNNNFSIQTVKIYGVK